MDRCPQYKQGHRAGVKFAVDWLHRRVEEMNDPHAKQILNSAAWNLGNDGKAVVFGKPQGRDDQ